MSTRTPIARLLHMRGVNFQLFAVEMHDPCLSFKLRLIK